jgi:hypothetical protein
MAGKHFNALEELSRPSPRRPNHIRADLVRREFLVEIASIAHLGA